MAKHRKVNALRKWLDGQGKSNRWLAELLDISDAYASELLSGKRRPSLEMSLLIQDKTGISPAVLIGRKVAILEPPRKRHRAVLSTPIAKETIEAL